MKKEQLEKKIAELTAQKQQNLANANACDGAIMAYQDVLNNLPKEDDTTEEA